jgi:DNA helicase II / ATP-dependent DNA helicase PcrA
MYNLNAKQLAAVTCPLNHHVLVDSGAGTGKTSVIVARLVHLLDSVIEPDKIWLLTFTNVAGTEMVKRASSRHPLANKVGAAGTFHSLAARLIRQAAVALKAKIDSGAELTTEETAAAVWMPEMRGIIDTAEAVSRIKKIIKTLPEDEAAELPTASKLQEAISASANRRVPVGQLVAKKCAEIAEAVAEQYRAGKRETGELDFDDLLDFLLLLLRSGLLKADEIPAHVLVDEYQDVNQTQTDILITLAGMGAMIYAVGDPCQSIYAFRGAEVSSIINFRKMFPGSSLFTLDQNYRSADPILALANELSIHAGVGKPKSLRSGISGKEPEYWRPWSDEDEAEQVVRRIAELINSGVDPEQICVMSKSGVYSRHVEMRLSERRIGFVKLGGMQLAKMQCVKDLAALIRIRIDSKDIAAWRRVFSAASGCGLGEGKSAGMLISEMQNGAEGRVCRNDHLCCRNVGGRTFSTLKIDNCEFCDWIDANAGMFIFEERYEPKGKNKDIGIALKDAVSEMKYYVRSHEVGKIIKIAAEWLKLIALNRYDAADRRIKDLEQLCEAASRYDSLTAFLDAISLEHSASGEDATGKVVVSTVHSVKGLEYKYVFLIGAVEGIWPRGDEDQAGMQELYRLGYVAVTRAARELIISAPKRVQINGVSSSCKESKLFFKKT